MQKEKMFTGTNILLALGIMLFVCTFAVVATLFFRPLYYYDMGRLDIQGYSGLAEDEIRANYDALIDYNSVFWRGELRFPSMPMSEGGRIHFEEVKDIFDGVQVLAMVSFVAVTAGSVLKLRRRKAAFLKLAGIASLAVPAVLGALVAVSWERFFLVFHAIFFRNNYWLFDPATDPVIRILPDTFFLHCAVMILALVVCMAVGLFVAGGLLQRRFARKTLLPEDVGQEIPQEAKSGNGTEIAPAGGTE